MLGGSARRHTCVQQSGGGGGLFLIQNNSIKKTAPPLEFACMYVAVNGKGAAKVLGRDLKPFACLKVNIAEKGREAPKPAQKRAKENPGKRR